MTDGYAAAAAIAPALGAEAWTPAWVVLVMLGGLIAVIALGLVGAVLVWVWSGRARVGRDDSGGEATPGGIPDRAPTPPDQG
jgi:hypothetical protein